MLDGLRKRLARCLHPERDFELELVRNRAEAAERALSGWMRTAHKAEKRADSAERALSGWMRTAHKAEKRADSAELRAAQAEWVLRPFADYAIWVLDHEISVNILEDDFTLILGGDGYMEQPRVLVRHFKNARNFVQNDILERVDVSAGEMNSLFNPGAHK